MMFSALQEVLSQWSTRKYCTRKEFQLLIAGRLHYVCMVAWPGRTCFCRMIDLLPCVLEQRWRSGESARLQPMCSGFDSRSRRYIWVEFVVGSLLCSERFFSGYSSFPFSQKNQHFPNSNSILNCTGISESIGVF